MIDFFKRFDNYMIYKDLNDNKISVEAGISNGLIGKARKRGSLSLENISKLLYAYPELSGDWLLTGKGTMLKSEVKSECDCNELENLKKINDLQDFKIKALEQEISCLKKVSKV